MSLKVTWELHIPSDSPVYVRTHDALNMAMLDLAKTLRIEASVRYFRNARGNTLEWIMHFWVPTAGEALPYCLKLRIPPGLCTSAQIWGKIHRSSVLPHWGLTPGKTRTLGSILDTLGTHAWLLEGAIPARARR